MSVTFVTIPVYSDETDTTYEFEYEIRWNFDPCYGADADGNRGDARWWIDDINYLGADRPLLREDHHLVADYEEFAREKALSEGPDE